MDTSSVGKAIEAIVKTTRFSMFQVIRVMELISKYDNKAVYRMTKKQKTIFKLLLSLTEGFNDNGNRDRDREKTVKGKQTDKRDDDKPQRKQRRIQDKEG